MSTFNERLAEIREHNASEQDWENLARYAEEHRSELPEEAPPTPSLEDRIAAYNARFLGMIERLCLKPGPR